MPNTPMDYYQAEKIRNTGFFERVLSKTSADPSRGQRRQGYGEALGNTISEGFQARVKMFKKRLDPMFLTKAIFGGGKIGSGIATGFLGKNRSQSDVDYFAGKKQKRGSATSIPNMEYTEGLGGDAVETLNSMLSFMKSTREEDKRNREVKQNFEEEKASEEQRRHGELLKALGVTKTAAPVKQQTSDSESLYERIMNSVKSMLQTVVSSIETMVKGLITAAMASIGWIKNLKFLAKLSPNILSTLYKILTSPILRLLGGPLLMVGGILGLSYLLGEAVKMVPNMKAHSPTEAKNILELGTWADIENAGGEEKLRSIISDGPERARQLMETGTDEEILEAGGMAKLNQIVREGAVTMPTNDIPQMPESVPPRSKKNPGMATVWDQNFSKFFDPETGKRLAKDNFDDVEMKKLKRQNGTPETVPQSTISQTNVLSDLMEQRRQLELEDMSDDGGQANIVSMNNNVSSEKSAPYSSTASQRDETSILNSVIQGYKTYTV